MEIEKTEPLEMKIMGKDGKTEFHLYIDGNRKRIEHAIKYLQEYLLQSKKIKSKLKTKSRNGGGSKRP